MSLERLKDKFLNRGNGHSTAPSAEDDSSEDRLESALRRERVISKITSANRVQQTGVSAAGDGLVGQLVHGVNQSSRLDEIFPIIARELGNHLGVDRLAISLPNKDRSKWIIEYIYRRGEVTTPHLVFDAEEFASFKGFADGDVMLCEDVETDPRVQEHYLADYLKPIHARAFMAIRLIKDGDSRLIIWAIMTNETRKWFPEEVEVVRAAVDQASVALQRAELFEQVLEGKHQWEATFDALTDGIFMFDRQGMLVRINQAGAAFEGASVDSLIGRQCCTLMQGAEGEACRVAQVISTGRPVTFELAPRKLGRPVLVTMSPILDRDLRTAAASEGESENSQTVGAVCVVRDLSELRAAEAIAREQRNFLVKLIEHANDAIFAFAPDGKLVWFNEQLVSLSGYSRVELSSADYRLFVSGDDKKVAVERFGRALIGEPQTFDIGAYRKDGEERLLMMTLSPVYDEGGVTSVLTIARDITEDRLAAERAAQADKLRALGQLASGVAHNFNNILAAIIGHAQLIKRDCQDDVTAQRMDIIERAALDGAETVKRIQVFGLQQNEVSGELVDLSQIARESTELTRARWYDEARARGLRFEVELNLKEVPVVRGQASELREVFVNIILNALDAMPQGGKLRISTDMYAPYVRAIFTDTGLGMSRQTVEHIFEPFFTTKGASGMGLGLAVSYSIIERHNGRIEAASAPGRGTTFAITIPMVAMPKKAPVLRTSKRSFASVLVIDDDVRVREALVAMLNSAGHQTEWAESAREGLAKMELGRFDLVFTDLSMPEMDGWTLATEVRRGWPSVKIVLVTGSGVSPEDVGHYRELVDDVIFKPLRVEDVNSTLRHILT